VEPLEHPYLVTLLRLLLAVLAGALIGLERTYHGRPAGFRTHTLVCTASSLLMLFTVYQWELIAGAPLETVRIDPTRMAQGIMTGIGFLGAGAIMKDKVTVRGLTTAASIWMTASIGIIIGMGFHFAALLAVVLALMTLSFFRWVEAITPGLHYARLTVRFVRDARLSEKELHDLFRLHHTTSASLSYHLEKEGRTFQYRMTIRSRDPRNFERLVDSLSGMEAVQEFSLVPTGD
jgi:putative Mg2+ transporter-C (MgtC) family protein